MLFKSWFNPKEKLDNVTSKLFDLLVEKSMTCDFVFQHMLSNGIHSLVPSVEIDFAKISSQFVSKYPSL